MLGSEVLLDTNAAIAWLRKDPAFAQFIVRCGPPGLSVVALGELRFGALNSGHVQRNLANLDLLMQDIVLLPIDSQTAECYSELSLALRRRGRPIPDNDLWIAATAQQHRLPLVSRDQHFTQVPGLELLTW